MDITWNETSSSGIPGLVFSNPVRQLLGEHRGTFQAIPGRRGSWYFPELRGRRTITVPGFFTADAWPADRRDSAELLADWLDCDLEANLTFGDDPDYFYRGVIGDCGDLTEWRELGTFELIWHVEPFAYELVESHASFYGSDDFTEAAWDPGVFTPVEPVIVLTPQDGTMTEIQLNINLESIEWSGLVNSGDSLTINSISATVTTGPNGDSELVGAFDSDLLNMEGVVGAFAVLVPGLNFIDFRKNSGTATDIHVDVYYRKAHRR